MTHLTDSTCYFVSFIRVIIINQLMRLWFSPEVVMCLLFIARLLYLSLVSRMLQSEFFRLNSFRLNFF